jgi:predicted NBD/HSP70 family sugar kinase
MAQLLTDQELNSGTPLVKSAPVPEQATTPSPAAAEKMLLPPSAALPTQSPGTTPASQTTQAPPAAVNTAPVVPAPVLGSVDAKSTVAGQIRELLSSGNPYVEQARQRSREAASSRGLLNSTMAVQAGEEAAIAGALPIASQDAQANFNQGLANQSAQNSFGLNEQQIQGQSRLQGESSIQRMAEAAKAGDIQSRQLLEQFGYNFQLSAQENINRLNLLDKEGQLRLGEISAQGDQSARLAAIDFNYRASLLDREAGINLTLEDKRFQNQQQLLFTEFAQRLNLAQDDSRLQIERMNVQHQQTLAQIAAQAEATRIADYGPRLQAQYLASVSDRMNGASNEIAQIYSTQGLTAAQQQTAVANAYQRVNQDLGALQAYYQQSPLWDPAWGSQTIQTPGQTTTPGSGPIMTTPEQSPGFSQNDFRAIF